MRLPALLLLAAALPLGAQDYARLRELRTSAQRAYERKDYAAFLVEAREAARLFPDLPAQGYNLACAQALVGQADAAFATLAGLAERRVFFDLAADTDLAALRADPRFAALQARFLELKRPVGTARTALQLAERDLLTEGLAHDPRSGDLFMSSVHKRKVVRVTPDGRAADFVTAGRDGLFGALALRVDPARRLLWVASAAVPEMQDARPEEQGRSALFAFALEGGRLVHKLLPPGPEARHSFNDLALDGRGTLYLSDSVSGQLFSLPPDATALRELLPAGRLASPQGLALAEDGHALYVADYGRGLFQLDLASGALQPVAAPADAVLVGIDGLLVDRGELLAIQNGIEPQRVVRLRLDAAGTRVSAAEVLALGLPPMDEPTLGVPVGDELLFVANSQWGAFARGRRPAPEQLGQPTVLALRLR